MKCIKQKKVDYIDDYISDIQGFDLAVLKTLAPMINQRKIKRITCETTKDKYKNIYKDLPDNSFKEFEKYLSKNYKCVAKGWGILKEESFNEVPSDWWEFDSMWKLK